MNRLLSIAAMALAALCATAQADIKFLLPGITHDELPASAAATINTRLNQALNRSGAVSENPYTVFAIEPTIDFGEITQTEGMVQEVARIKAELTLTARNTADGTEYCSVTIPLRAGATGGRDAAMKAMAGSIKATDPVFVRFVRNARQKIADYYADNCATIIQRAQMLADQQKYDEALSYLSAVSDAVPCFDQASVMITELAPYAQSGPDTVIIERTIEKPVERIVNVPSKPDTVVVEKIVEKVVEVPVAAAPAKPKATPNCRVVVDSDEITFKVLGCSGNPSQGRIVILTEIENSNPHQDRAYTEFMKAFTDNGIELNDLHIKGGSGMWSTINMPDGVPVKVEFYISGVKSDVTMLSFLEIRVRGIKVTVRDLAVKW